MNKSKFALPALLLVNILCMMDVSIMTIVIPAIQTAFRVSLTDLSWCVNIYTILFATLIIPLGRLAERIGQTKLIYIGMVIFAFGSLATGLSANLPIMLVARAIQSLGAALIVPTSMVVGLKLGEQEKRNKVIAALAGAQGLAVALGPVVGGFISEYLSWRWVFYINIPFLIILLIVFPIVFDLRHHEHQQVKIDWLGAVLSCLFLASLSLGLVKANDWGWASPKILILLTGAMVTFCLFLVQQRHTSSPMIDLTLFKNRNFSAASVMLLVCNYLLGGMVILIPTLLTKVQHESELHAALLITPYSVAVMLSVVLSSLFIKKVAPRLLIGFGLIIIAMSYALLAHLNLSVNYDRLIIADIFLGLGYGMVAAAANILIAADFHGQQLTDSQSVANILRQVGLIIAIALFSTILTQNMNTAKQVTRRYAEQQINAQKINASLKKQLVSKVEQQLRQQNTSNATPSLATSTGTAVKFEQQAVAQAYQQQLRRYSAQVGLPLTAIPTATQQVLYQKVLQATRMQIRTKLKETTRILTQTAERIKHHMVLAAQNAFMSVYQMMFYVPLIALPCCLFFKKKYD